MRNWRVMVNVRLAKMGEFTQRGSPKLPILTLFWCHLEAVLTRNLTRNLGGRVTGSVPPRCFYRGALTINNLSALKMPLITRNTPTRNSTVFDLFSCYGLNG